MNKENLANGLLASAVSTSATSATLQSGYGGTMPAVPFKLTVTPFGQLSTKGNSEIWLVTARTGEVLTITRGQDGTTAKAFVAGDIVANGVYVSDFLGGNSFVQKETPTGLVNGTNNVFTTSQAYAPGSLMVYVNGFPQFQFAVETDPTTGSFTIEDAPSTGDFVRVSYQPVTAKFGNADTVDNYHANATPTANNIPVLDSNALMPMAAIARDYIQVVLSGTYSMTATSATVPLNSTEISKGTKLTRSGSTVVVGAGVSRVRVSYTLMAESMSSAPYLFARVRINSTDSSQSLNGAASGFGSTGESRIFNVNPGDTISIWADCGGGSSSLTTGRRSYMLVEVIE